MITTYDVQEFLQKYAADPLPAGTDVKPEPTATGAPGIPGTAGAKAMNWLRNNKMMAVLGVGMPVYDILQGAKQTYEGYDQQVALQKQLGEAIRTGQVNSLGGRNPFLVKDRSIMTDFEKDRENMDINQASLRDLRRQMNKEKMTELTSKLRGSTENTRPVIRSDGSKDYTQLAKFQRENKTTTVPVRETSSTNRYQRG